MSNPNPGNAHLRQKGMKKIPGSGQKKGSLNPRTVGKMTAISEGKSPLEFFESVMHGETQDLPDGKKYVPSFEDMKWGAAQAAPFRHSRLQTTTHKGEIRITHEEALLQLDDDEATEIDSVH